MVAAPAHLSETGLYSDIVAGTIDAQILEYTPLYPLWSDGAEKRRFIYLPTCAPIDTTKMDNWKFPIGARVWKEFKVNGQLIETRLMHRFGPGIHDWFYASYLWNDSNTDADLVDITGAADVKGTTHNIPSVDDCKNCHTKLPERVLGFSAIQLSHDGPGATMASLSAAGMLSVPAPNGFVVPGNDVERAALGYIHSNCGNCHNASGLVTMKTRVLTTDTTVEGTDTFKACVNRQGAWSAPGILYRIAPGNPEASSMYYRMTQRGNPDNMPQIATEIVDPDGMAAVKAWIEIIPPDANP
ncbi:MAG: hypothetical protein U0165_01045 [Polyangiaceae bacterium]